MTFGIPQHILPISVLGNVDVSHHKAFLQERQSNEKQFLQNPRSRNETSNDTNGSLAEGEDCQSLGDTNIGEVCFINVPGPMDVLLGRGRTIQEHMGNVRFRDIVETYRSRYDMARRPVKTQLTKEIVQKVNKSGGQFLKRNSASSAGPWIEVSMDVAQQKVSHSFRDKRRFNVATAGSKTTEKRNNSKEDTSDFVEPKRVKK